MAPSSKTSSVCKLFCILGIFGFSVHMFITVLSRLLGGKWGPSPYRGEEASLVALLSSPSRQEEG